MTTPVVSIFLRWKKLRAPPTKKSQHNGISSKLEAQTRRQTSTWDDQHHQILVDASGELQQPVAQPCVCPCSVHRLNHIIMCIVGRGGVYDASIGERNRPGHLLCNLRPGAPSKLHLHERSSFVSAPAFALFSFARARPTPSQARARARYGKSLVSPIDWGHSGQWTSPVHPGPASLSVGACYIVCVRVRVSPGPDEARLSI